MFGPGWWGLEAAGGSVLLGLDRVWCDEEQFELNPLWEQVEPLWDRCCGDEFWM